MKTESENLVQESPPVQIPRIPTSRIPHEVSARALLSPRITGKSRRLFMRSRDMIVDLPRADHDEQATYCRAIKHLTMAQLHRRQTQISRKMRQLTAYLEEHQLEYFRRLALDELQLLEYRKGWLKQEIESRRKQ